MSDSLQNTDWQLKGKASAKDLFSGKLVPDLVLIDYGVPILFTARGAGSLQFLVFHVEEIQSPAYCSRYIAVPATPQTVTELESGARSIRDALTGGWMWVVDTDEAGHVSDAVHVDESDIPADALPDATTMISPALEPAITLRYTGDQLSKGHVPASVIQTAGESVQAALRVLVDHLTGARGSRGRRTKDLTTLYNLGAQRVAMGSLEIAFRRPVHTNAAAQQPLGFADSPVVSEPQDLREIEEQMWGMLRDGLNWTVAANEPLEPTEDRLATLRALEKLAPKSSVIEQLEVTGKMVARPDTDEGYRLNRDTSLRIRTERLHLEEALQSTEETRVYKGLIRYVDPDLWSLMLRDEDDLLVDPPAGTVFNLTDQQDFELALDLSAKAQPVAIVAKRQLSPGKTPEDWEVTQISLLAGSQKSAGEQT